MTFSSVRSRILATSTGLVVGFVALVLAISWVLIHDFADQEIRRDLADSVRAFDRYFLQQREMLARKTVAVSRVPYLVAALAEGALDEQTARATLDEIRGAVGDSGVVLVDDAGGVLAQRMPEGLRIDDFGKIVDVDRVLAGESIAQISARPKPCVLFVTPVIAGRELVGALALCEPLDHDFANELHLVTARDVLIFRAVERAHEVTPGVNCIADHELRVQDRELVALSSQLGANAAPRPTEAISVTLAGKRRLARFAKLGSSDVYVVFSRALDELVDLISSAWGLILLAGLLVAIVGVLLSTALARRLARPIDELASASNALASGDLHACVDVESEDEIGRLGASFNSMARRIESLIADVREEAQRAEAASKAKDRFLACVSHELRTPLTNVFAYAEILESMRDPKSRSDEDEFLAIIKVESERLMDLIDGVMELVAFDAEVMRFVKIDFDVEAFVRELAREFRERWENISVEVASGAELSTEQGVERARAHGDAARLRKVLEKVLKNALLWSPEGGHIVLRVVQLPREVEIHVVDQGPGVPESERERVFERFYQVGNGLTDKPAGTGLGLAFARELMQVHGGSIRCEAAPSGGADFVLVLPRFGTESSLHDVPRRETAGSV